MKRHRDESLSTNPSVNNFDTQAGHEHTVKTIPALVSAANAQGTSAVSEIQRSTCDTLLQLNQEELRSSLDLNELDDLRKAVLSRISPKQIEGLRKANPERFAKDAGKILDRVRTEFKKTQFTRSSGQDGSVPLTKLQSPPAGAASSVINITFKKPTLEIAKAFQKPSLLPIKGLQEFQVVVAILKDNRFAPSAGPETASPASSPVQILTVKFGKMTVQSVDEFAAALLPEACRSGKDEASRAEPAAPVATQEAKELRQAPEENSSPATANPSNSGGAALR